MAEEPQAAEHKAGDRFLQAARMVAWELDAGTGKVRYTAAAGTEQIQACLDEKALMSEVVAHALRGTGTFSFDSRVVRTDGSVIWIRHQGEVQRDETGQPARVIGIALDITGRKETDERLRDIVAGVSAATGEAFFRLLAQQLCQTLHVDFTCIGEFRGNNRDRVQTVAMFGEGQCLEGLEYELEGTPCQEAVVAGRCSYPKGVQSAFPKDRLLADLGLESYVGVGLTGSNGERVGVMSVMSRLPIDNVESTNAILSIFAFRAAAELERRKWEDALRESETWNRTILSALPDTILVLDRNGVIRSCYAKSAGALNIPRELVRGEKLQRVLSPEAAELVLQSVRTLEQDGASVVEYALPVLGQLRFYEARTVGFGDGNLLMVIRDISDRKSTEADLMESRRLSHRFAETTPNVLFIYDLIENRNVYVNERSVDIIGYTPKEIEEMGDTFIPRLMHPDDQAVLPMIAKDYDIRKDGEIFEHIFRFKHKNGQWRWLHRIATIFSRTPDGRPKQILGTIADITRFKQAERDLQELSARLLTAQDEERRRIARELHDVTGQNLGVIAVHLGTLERRSGEIAPGVRELLSECQRLCSESQKEIRALSYLLHPPELDLLGLVGALRGYLQGYEKRTGIRAILDVKKDIGRLPSELETDLFRVVQEGLTNIMRHSGSETAVVRLEKSETHITLQVEDKGRGLPSQLDSAERQLIGFGVGITGMRERLRQHGGTLEIHSSPHGTILRGVVPLNPPGR